MEDMDKVKLDVYDSSRYSLVSTRKANEDPIAMLHAISEPV
jgi:hypothetical protein